MKTKVASFFSIALIAIIVLLVNYQQKLLFFPHKLSDHHAYRFKGPFEEINLTTDDGLCTINCVLFDSQLDTVKGVVFFLHGNSGHLQGWGGTSALYTEIGYDVLYYDYRGFGKSSCQIKTESEFLRDANMVYNFLKTKYEEEEIIVTGTSIGTGPASWLAEQNTPHLLILNAPFYTLESLIQEKVFLIPKSWIRFKLKNNEALSNATCPVYIFHGHQDRLIPIKHSQKLSTETPSIQLFELGNCGHNDFFSSEQYKALISDLLE